MHKNLSKFLAALLTAIFAGGIFIVYAQNTEPPLPPKKVGYPLMESPHSNPIAVNGKFVYVTNTPSSTVDVIDRESDKIVERIHVGIDPVSIAVRPDGKEVWVSNHVSDSVSVVDTDPKSPTFHVVIATIQDFDNNKATTFDEPVGIAFANNEKAYVALSSENQIAVINVKTKKVTDRLWVQAQDPRAITVRNGKLYIIPFESGNRTQLSGGRKENIDSKFITFDGLDHIMKDDSTSYGFTINIIKHPKQPDLDLFVYDTSTNGLINTISSIGTLLYGVTVDSKGTVYIAQTDARNDVNGLAGTKGHTFKELENRIYLNQIAKVSITDNDSEKNIFELEPLPPKHPDKNKTLATPYAVQISDDDKILVASAAASNKIFTLDTLTGKVLDQISVGNGPRGIALEKGKLFKAWIYNAFDNSVSLLDLSDSNKIKLVSTLPLEDPTDPSIKKGRIHFNSAFISGTGTFSCASCHPDGHTDQLLWVLNTPYNKGGRQVPPRLTQPVRGLRDTGPYHWDKTNLSLTQLINRNISSLMTFGGKDTSSTLNDNERKDLETYLLNVPYPPAPKRAYTNVLTDDAKKGFSLFHIEGDLDPNFKGPKVCGNCHRLPFLTSPTNGPMKATTWRGAYDRFVNHTQARMNIIDLPWVQKVVQAGRYEFSVWQLSWGGSDENANRQNLNTRARRFNPVWNMVLEMSTGHSGAFARQITIGSTDTNQDLWNSMESAASQGAVVLEADGAFFDGVEVRKVQLQFDPIYKGGVYVDKTLKDKFYYKADLIRLSEQGKFIATFTAKPGSKVNPDNPQPAIWTTATAGDHTNSQNFPTLSSNQLSMTVNGRHFKENASVYVDGIKVKGSVNREIFERMTITLSTPPSPGLHLIQVQMPNGLFSNEFIFHYKQ